MTKALVIVGDGVEEMEAVGPVDLLRRAGVEVTVASREDRLLVEGRNQIKLQADKLLGEVMAEEYDAVVLPGGPGFKAMREDQRVLDILRRQNAAGRLTAAICAAPAVLQAAGVLDGRAYTAHMAVKEELPHLREDEAVVREGHVVTSRGAGTATEFGLELIDYLEGEEAALKVAESICFRPGLME